MNNTVLRILSASFLAVILFTSCGSKYNKTKFKDPNFESPEIYGEVGNPEPLQLARPYTPDTNVAAESKEVTPKFREKVEQSVQR